MESLLGSIIYWGGAYDPGSIYNIEYKRVNQSRDDSEKEKDLSLHCAESYIFWESKLKAQNANSKRQLYYVQ